MENKVLITGFSGGIGSLISKKLLERNFHITGISRTIDVELTPHKNIDFHKVDLSDLSNLEKIIPILSQISFDLVIFCTGIFKIKEITEYSNSEIEEDIVTNFSSTLALTSAILPNMKKNKKGKIIFIGSSSSYSGFANTSVYCACKHGILGFSRSLAEELRDYNIRVTCISPGTVNTNMSKVLEKNQDKDTFISADEFCNLILHYCLAREKTLWQEEIQVKRIQYK